MRNYVFLCLLAPMLAVHAYAAGIANAPAPFDKGGVKVALVSLISEGDFFQAYEAGARREAKALGIDLRVLPGRGDAAAERDAIQQAINLGVKGLIIDHGMPEATKDIAQQALDAGIKLVAFDVDLGNPRIPQVQQNDQELAQLVLDRALQDNGESFEAGLIYVAGFAPLDRRHAVWEKIKHAHPGIREVARWGTAESPVATAIADQTAAALRANPGIQVIFAPWDEFARGAKLAIDEAGKSAAIRIYSADISTSDIQAMREPGSAWVATAATNPAVMGEISVRTVAILLAGQDPGHDVRATPVLITADLLRRENIHNLQELAAHVPDFAHSSAAVASWMPDDAR